MVTDGFQIFGLRKIGDYPHIIPVKGVNIDDIYFIFL